MTTPSADADVTVHGLSVMPLSQCHHWNSPRDIIAIRHACCEKFYACITCHDALAGHTSQVWPRETWTTRDVVRCGACRRRWTVAQYFACVAQCPGCAAAFNPGCARHYHLYFDMDEDGVSREEKECKTVKNEDGGRDEA